MINAPPLPRFRRFPAIELGLLSLLVVVVTAAAAPTLHWMAFSPADVQPGRDPEHADKRHGGEKYPPDVIRTCIAAMAVPFEYRNGSKIAFLCRLARNRWGIQIVDAASRREITSFYGTLARMKNILARDGYTSVVPLP